MRPLGLFLIAVACAAPLIWFAPLIATRDPLAAFSQFIGTEALILMGIAQLLATRLRPLESIFGGLDRIYVLHKWLGIAAMVCVLLHDTIDADMQIAGAGGLSEDIGETLGEISLYGLLILVTLTIATFVPYELWRWTHRTIGTFFAFSAAHYLLIAKPFSIWDPLGLYISAFCLLGVLAYLFALARFATGRLGAEYQIEAVAPEGDALAIECAPAGAAIRARPGQFAFVSFGAPDLGEVHPFTLSRAPDGDGRIRFTIKALGDFTGSLASGLAPGQSLKVSNGHGRFLRLGSAKGEIWIAGGVGVTPFAAWAEARAQAPSRQVDFYYCCSGPAAHLGLFEDWASADADFRLHLIDSRTEGRLDAERIAKTTGTPISDAAIYFCGPEGMRQDLLASLGAHGMARRRFHFEVFEIRSGLGLRRLLAAVFERFG